MPFLLTNSQKTAIEALNCDFCSDTSCNRLIQGDTGSGKTLVALWAMFLAAENGYQSVLIAPTQILATQHFLLANALFKNCNFGIEILKNGQKSQFFNSYPLKIWAHIMVFFNENNVSFEKELKATPKSIELSKSEKYKKFIDKEFEILKVYLEANGDEKFIAEIEKIFTELNDKESLEKLEKLGYKLKKDNLENILENIRRQNNDK